MPHVINVIGTTQLEINLMVDVGAGNGLPPMCASSFRRTLRGFHFSNYEPLGRIENRHLRVGSRSLLRSPIVLVHEFKGGPLAVADEDRGVAGEVTGSVTTLLSAPPT